MRSTNPIVFPGLAIFQSHYEIHQLQRPVNPDRSSKRAYQSIPRCIDDYNDYKTKDHRRDAADKEYTEYVKFYTEQLKKDKETRWKEVGVAPKSKYLNEGEDAWTLGKEKEYKLEARKLAERTMRLANE